MYGILPDNPSFFSKVPKTVAGS